MKGLKLGLACSLTTSIVYALPFTITPKESLPTSYPGYAAYTITKNTASSPTGNVIKWLPPNTTIVASGTTCGTRVGTPFTLEKGQSCTLNLTVFGSVSRDNPNPNQHLMVCLADGVTCAGPSPENSIDNTGTQYGYVADNNGNVYYCTLNANGSFNTCTTTPSSGAPNWVPFGVTFATVNGVQYGYVADFNGGNIYQCTLNSNNTFNTCTQTPEFIRPNWSPNSVSFGTFNGTQYAYVADGNNYAVYRCTLNSDGSLNICSVTPSSGAPNWDPIIVTFATVNGTQYAYVGDYYSNVYYCTLNTNGTFNTCSITPSSGAPSGWGPYGIAFATINGTQRAYVADNFNGNMYECTLNTNGTFNTCSITPSSGAPSNWYPFGVAFATVGGIQYAYVGDTKGNVYYCTLNADGSFKSCTATPSSGVPNWAPNGITFVS